MSRPTGFTGPVLIRLLARLDDSDLRDARTPAPALRGSPATADRLSQWIRWTDAISLSEALNGSPRAAPSVHAVSVVHEEAQCARVREALVRDIAEDAALSPRPGTPLEFPLFHRRLLAREQAMTTRIGDLRGRLRATLAGAAPSMARLAAVDAAMEQVLEVRERKLVARLPSLLEKRFERLQQAAEPNWPAAFRKDFQDALLAELEFRFQPIEGLLEALRTRPQAASS